jgi:hypothetical protein
LPHELSGQAGIAFQGSSCTNNVTGAYSNAALASQSLGELSESSTESATRTTMSSIAGRRADEQQHCGDGMILVNRTCVPAPSRSRFASEPSNMTAIAMPDALLSFAPRLPKAIVKAPPPDAPHWAVWTQAYGNYERQSGQSPGLGEFSTLALTVNSTSSSGGVLAGADYTVRNIVSGDDGLILGILTGIETAHVSLSTSSISSDPTSPNGFSTMSAQLNGPAFGVYSSYFNGRFSTDLAFKAELYALSVSFTDLLGFQSNPAFGFPPTSVPFAGSGMTRLTNSTVSANVNYRIPTGISTWIEPTAGIQGTISSYAASAAQFGLADGTLVRLQGGARLGIEDVWNGMRTTTIVTGLLYDDVSVTGNVMATAPNPTILSGEGKLRAEGLLTLNFHLSNGVSSFVQAEVQGGDGLFGAGGKAGVRFAW